MDNPLTGKPLSAEAADRVEQLRAIRRNARKAARSGNPAKHAPARRVLKQVAPLLAAIYRQEAAR